MKKWIAVGAAALWIGNVAAEQQFGVEVYPGAKPSPSTNEFLKTMKLTAEAYVTGDALAKVIGFYKSQPGLTQNPGADSTQAGFTGKNVTITIQNPWLDMKGGKKMESTLVSIVKQ